MNSAMCEVRMMAPPQALLFTMLQDQHRALRHQEKATQVQDTDPFLPSVRYTIYGARNGSVKESAKWKTNTTEGALKCLLRKTIGSKTKPPYMYNNSGRTNTYKGVVTVYRAPIIIKKHKVRKKQWKHFKVDLLQKTCECGWGNLLDSPCSHILGYADHRQFPINRLLRAHQTRESWLASGGCQGVAKNRGMPKTW